MPAWGENGKSMVGTGERGRKLISTLRRSKARTQSQKQHQLEE
jgi:hypothetical protein